MKSNNKTAADAADAELHTPGVLGEKGIRELAQKYMDAVIVEVDATGDLDTATHDRALRQALAAAGVRPECIEVEFKRVMDAVLAS